MNRREMVEAWFEKVPPEKRNKLHWDITVEVFRFKSWQSKLEDFQKEIRQGKPANQAAMLKHLQEWEDSKAKEAMAAQAAKIVEVIKQYVPEADVTAEEMLSFILGDLI